MDKSRTFWGILFILGAFGVILTKLGYMPDISIVRLIIAGFLLVTSLKNIRKKEFFGVFFPLAFIAILFSKELGIVRLTPGTLLLAALFASIGFSMIFKKKPSIKYEYNNFQERSNTINIEDSSYIRLETMFSESIKYINSNCFERADLNSTFGSMKIYFNGVSLENGRGEVDISARFSGVELYIPKDWKLENKTNTVFGAIKEKNYTNEVKEEVLTLTGDVLFSEVDIFYI